MEPLATVEELRLWVQDPALDAATATVLLVAASAQVRAATGQDFTAVSGDTIVLDGVEGEWLALPQRPVTAVSSVAINDTTLDASGWTLSGNRIYRWHGWQGQTSSWGPTLVTVTYDHGYVEIPDDVRSATLALAADMLANPQGLTDEQIDDYRWRRDAQAAAAAPSQALLAAVVRTYRGTARSVRLVK